MTIIETPASAQDLPHADQARKHLTDAGETSCTPLSSYGSNHTLNYGPGLAALRDAQIGTGHALLAMQAELEQIRGELRAGREETTAIRKELAGIADAVRELTAAVTTVAEPLAEAADQLVDIATGIDAVATAGGRVSEVAEAIDALAEDLDTYRRRSWRERLFGRRPAAMKPEAMA